MMKKVLLILLALILVFGICACKKDGQNGTSDSAVESADPKETGDYYRTEDETYTIETPYGPLYYPVMWKDTVKIDMMEEGSVCKVSFNAMLDTYTVPLYTIVFGESETGYLICNLPTDNGTVAVYCEDQSAGQSEKLSDASKETYMLMSESINVIIANLMDAVNEV